jgi:hypothetical protein
VTVQHDQRQGVEDLADHATGSGATECSRRNELGRASAEAFLLGGPGSGVEELLGQNPVVALHFPAAPGRVGPGPLVSRTEQGSGERVCSRILASDRIES